MRLLKIVCGQWLNPSRDLRELEAAQEAGFEVSAIIKKSLNIDSKTNSIYGVKVIGLKTKPLGNFKALTPINHLLTIVFWANYIRKREDEVLSCHDLSALLVGYLSNLFAGKKKKILIYDSHEFEIGRAVKRGRLKKKLILMLERFLATKVEQTILVGNLIANEFVELHKLRKFPLVIRNIPERWEVDKLENEKCRNRICKKLNLKNEPFIIMYHGMIMPNRGIENLIKILKCNKKIVLVVLGNGTNQYIESLKSSATELEVNERVLFLDAVLHNELKYYIGAVDLGMCLIQNVSKSYYLSLPNKLFENIQGETPVLASDFPEMKKIIDEFEIGMTCNPNDTKQINECINRMIDDEQTWNRYKVNIIKAKQELCWEKEKIKLVNFYKELYSKLMMKE